MGLEGCNIMFRVNRDIQILAKKEETLVVALGALL